MKATKLIPMYRVPHEEPGLQFFRGKNGQRWLPLQKGCELADEQKHHVNVAEPPAWLTDGDYWVFGADFDDGSKDYLAIGVREGAEMVWAVQANQHLQGQAAKKLLPDFDWRVCDPLSPVIQANLELTKAMRMYPDLKWTVAGRVGDKDVVLGNDPDVIRAIEEVIGAN